MTAEGQITSERRRQMTAQPNDARSANTSDAGGQMTIE